MKVALLAHGTRGDVQPLLAVAHALGRRGHDVRMAVSDDQAAWAARSGVEVVAHPGHMQRLLHSAHGREMLANGRLSTLFGALDRDERRANPGILACCDRICHDVDLVLAGPLLSHRAAALAEGLGLPYATLCSQPIVATAHFASYLSPWRDLRLPFLNRASWHAMEAVYWRGQRDLVNAARSLHGLAPLARSPALTRLNTVHLYSPRLCALPGDYGPSQQQAADATLPPALRERLGEGGLPSALTAWLDAGEPPVFFGFGSIPVLDPGALLAMLSRVSKALGVRALVGAGWSDYDERDVPDHVHVVGALDFDRLMPRCRAAVHHGGAGTTHASLRAGLPTLVCAVVGDQAFWGHRVAKLGVGATLTFQRLSESKLQAALAKVLAVDVRARARALGRQLQAEDGTGLAVEAVERLALA